ncbi:hypothetical protein Q8A73_023654 [Channa argus]|nr:hypothetical protein Q8A73_023654 [Channa argus]
MNNSPHTDPNPPSLEAQETDRNSILQLATTQYCQQTIEGCPVGNGEGEKRLRRTRRGFIPQCSEAGQVISAGTGVRSLCVRLRGEDACACCSSDGERRRRKNEFSAQLTVNSMRLLILEKSNFYAFFLIPEVASSDSAAAAAAAAQLTWTGAHRAELPHVSRRAGLRYGGTAALRPGPAQCSAVSPRQGRRTVVDRTLSPAVPGDNQQQEEAQTSSSSSSSQREGLRERGRERETECERDLQAPFSFIAIDLLNK